MKKYILSVVCIMLLPISSFAQCEETKEYKYVKSINYNPKTNEDFKMYKAYADQFIDCIYNELQKARKAQNNNNLSEVERKTILARIYDLENIVNNLQRDTANLNYKIRKLETQQIKDESIIQELNQTVQKLNSIIEKEKAENNELKIQVRDILKKLLDAQIKSGLKNIRISMLYKPTGRFAPIQDKKYRDGFIFGFSLSCDCSELYQEDLTMKIEIIDLEVEGVPEVGYIDKTKKVNDIYSSINVKLGAGGVSTYAASLVAMFEDKKDKKIFPKENFYAKATILVTFYNSLGTELGNDSFTASIQIQQ